MEPSTPFQLTERAVEHGVQWLRLVIETTGAAIIALGVVMALGAFARAFWRRNDLRSGDADYTDVRLTLARYLALALEFQLGADILATAIAPTWTAIGRLGAIAVIRTALNYFLELEMRREAGEEQRGGRPADGATLR
ncbi:MAG: hypothetical protein AVDCRST_MAG11-3159 [uncultured Gemmatimonadaceae bacterium]|uniref:DUF1622 domain-containing protein n=1 Tax=uncultured Gemmatimonadaceae bacterium TaxID=246130 RepID=A0A6J4LY90_9BACT|nr:MAG: hypothetical protein AVDCRST_MAG11-3159 [uncultured Gemmatimonadaceae bacterium]